MPRTAARQTAPKSLQEPVRGPHFAMANRLFFRLYQASNLLHKNGTRYVDDFGATTQQWAVLGALARPATLKSGMSVKDMIEYLMLSRQNLTVVLDRLEARDWIERVKDPSDGRSRLIRLSREGQKVWNLMLDRIDAFYDAALAGFNAAEVAQLTQLLDRLRNSLKEV